MAPTGSSFALGCSAAGRFSQRGVRTVADASATTEAGLHERLGSPLFCYPFRPGYGWTRYSGETYRPLYSNDEEGLNERCRSLFPEYFKG
jgi:hypothetical protein